MAFGATTVFFSPASQREQLVEPQGLVGDLTDDDRDEETPEPSPSPSPSPTPAGGTADGTTTTAVSAPASAPQDDDPSPRRANDGSVISVMEGVNATND